MKIHVSKSYGVYLLFLVIFTTPSYGNPIIIEWVGFCSNINDINNSTIISYSEEERFKNTNYCIKQSETTFSPVMGIPTEEDYGPEYMADYIATNAYTNTALILIINTNGFPNNSNPSIKIDITEHIPICDKCDGGCYVLKEKRNSSYSRRVPAKSGLISFNFATYIKEWELLGLDVKVKITNENNMLVTDSISRFGWAWCM